MGESDGSRGGERSCLLVLDVQQGLVEGLGAGQVVARLRGCVEAARLRSVPVVYVATRFRPEHPEVHPRNAAFGAVAASGAFDVGSAGAELHSGLGAEGSEPVVVKRRVSPFLGTDLGVLLGSLGVGRVVLGGLTTAGVVLSAYREAADRDYSVTILSDGCADGDPEVHGLLLSKLFPQQATVVSCDQWSRGG